MLREVTAQACNPRTPEAKAEERGVYEDLDCITRLCFTSSSHLTQHPTEDVRILKLKEAKAKQEMEAQWLRLSERSPAAAAQCFLAL